MKEGWFVKNHTPLEVSKHHKKWTRTQTCTFAPNLEQHNHWFVEKPPLEPLTVNRFW
jgi:hypothetical protein